MAKKQSSDTIYMKNAKLAAQMLQRHGDKLKGRTILSVKDECLVFNSLIDAEDFMNENHDQYSQSDCRDAYVFQVPIEGGIWAIG